MAKGKKSALLVGCHYYDTGNPMYGCENDLTTIRTLLTESFGFTDISTLIETQPPNLQNQLTQPTRMNIQNAIRRMMINAGKGDILFIYFSGLGQLAGPSNNNIPAILSCDLKRLTAADFPSDQANQLPDEAVFTLVLESSYSGDFIMPVQPNDNRILFSACRANETAQREAPDNDNSRAFGAFTNAIKLALQDHPPPITNEDLLRYVNERMEHYRQLPCLHCNPKNMHQHFLGYLV